MDKAISIANLLKLSISERIQWVEDVWDSIVNVPEAVPLTEAHKKELDARLEDYHKNPSNGSPWNDIKKKLLS